MKKLTYMPTEKFLALSVAGHRQPDPVPHALVVAALLFVVTAMIAF